MFLSIRRTHSTLITCILLALCVCTPLTAYAGGPSIDLPDEELMTSTQGTQLTLTLLIIAGGIGMTAGGVLTTSLVTQLSDTTEDYIEEHPSEVYDALLVGDPESKGARDLSHIFGISPRNHARFARVLHDEREVLRDCVQEDVSDAQARAFVRHLLVTMSEDEALSEDVAWFMGSVVASTTRLISVIGDYPRSPTHRARP